MSTRTALTIVSFAAMIGASMWVVATNWPPGGMPLLAWPAHAAALVGIAVEMGARALKIQASADAVGAPLRFGTALRVCLGGDFAAGITPARSGAEPARFLILGEYGMPAPARVLVLFLELALEMVSLALVCAVLALLFQGRGASTVGLLSLVGGYSTIVIGAGVGGLLLGRHAARGPTPRWAARLGMHAGRWRAVQRVLRGLRQSVTALRHADRAGLALAFAASVVHVLGKVATLPLLVFLGDPSFPVTMDTLAPLVLWPLALFYGGVVVPAPGGGGFIEGAFAATLSGAIPAGIFAASLVWWRFYTFYLYLLAGALAAGSTVRRALQRPPAAPVDSSRSRLS